MVINDYCYVHTCLSLVRSGNIDIVTIQQLQLIIFLGRVREQDLINLQLGKQECINTNLKVQAF